jgi:hypothetical protein
MLRHIVLWKVKDQALGLEKAALCAEFKRRLEALVGVVPEIRSFEVGLNVVLGDTAADIGLVSSFDDLAALQRYVEHPVHQEVVAFVKQVAAERRAVDFEF